MTSNQQTANTGIVNALIGTSVSSLFVIVLTFVSGVLIARALGPEARGVYGGILLIVQTIATLVGLSIHDGFLVTLRRGSTHVPNRLATIVLTLLLCGLAAIPLVVILTPWLASRTDLSNSALLVFFATSFILLNATSTAFSTYERAAMRFRFTNISRVVAPLLFCIALIALLASGFGPLAPEHVLYLLLATKIPMLFVWMRWHASEFEFQIDTSLVKRSVLAGINLHWAVAIAVFAANIDRFFGLSLWDAQTLGLYFVAFSAVGAGFGIFVTAIRTVLFPYLSGLSKGDRPTVIPAVIRITSVASIVVALVGLIVVPPLIPSLYGEKFSGSVPIAVALLAPIGLTPLQAVVLEAGRSLGRGRPSIEMGISSLATMTLGFALLGFETPYELAIALTVSNALSIVVGSRHLIANGDIRFDRTLLPSLQDLDFAKAALQRRHTNG